MRVAYLLDFASLLLIVSIHFLYMLGDLVGICELGKA